MRCAENSRPMVASEGYKEVQSLSSEAKYVYYCSNHNRDYSALAHT